MEDVHQIFSKCEALIDRYVDYSPLSDSSLLLECQSYLSKLDNLSNTESLKVSDKSMLMYLSAGLNVMKEVPSVDTEANLLKSVY